MNNQRKWAIVMSMAFAVLTVKPQESYASTPSWFPGKLASCKTSIPGDLIYEVKHCVQRDAFGGCVQRNTANITIKDSVDQYTIKNAGKNAHSDKTDNSFSTDSPDLQNPGTGKCCIFDKDGNFLKPYSRYGKPIDPRPVTRGNDECAQLMSQTPDAKHYGIWWFVKASGGYKLDWEHGSQ